MAPRINTKVWIVKDIIYKGFFRVWLEYETAREEKVEEKQVIIHYVSQYDIPTILHGFPLIDITNNIKVNGAGHYECKKNFYHNGIDILYRSEKELNKRDVKLIDNIILLILANIEEDHPKYKVPNAVITFPKTVEDIADFINDWDNP